MLVLTRKKGEKIVIGDNIFLTVIEVKGDQVKLGIDAPREVSVHREEVFREIQEENIKAKKVEKTQIDQIQKLLKDKEGEERGN